MTLMKESEGQHIHSYCTRNSSYVGSNVGISSWSVSGADSCADRLNVEGGRDSAQSRVMYLSLLCPTLPGWW